MPQIFPAQDQALGVVIAELAAADLVQNRDYSIGLTWDHRPYLDTTDEAYAKWQAMHGADTDSASPDNTDADSSTDDSESGSSTRRQTKRR